MRLPVAAFAILAAFPSVAALARPGQGVPNPRYPDGTGDDQVDRLNSAQLDQNYRGPYYQQPAYRRPAYPMPAYPQPAYPPPGYVGGQPPS